MATVIKAGNVASGAQVTPDATGILQFNTGSGAGTAAMTIDTSQNVAVAGNLSVDGNTTLGNANTDTILMTAAPSIGGAGLGMGFGFRNRIINGAMMIDQRNAGASVTPTDGQYVVDRFNFGLSQASKLSAQQSSTAPTGFTKSFLITSLSAYTVGASERFLTTQAIEGLNVSDLAWGTASAATVTLSFWVRSSLTGTFGGALRNSAVDRSYPFSYTISAADTWEQKSVTIAGDTTGTWLTTNGAGIFLTFSLGAGSTLSNTAGAWVAGNYVSATGATSVVGTNGATFYITGVQLEKGSTATSFDYRPYGTELALCQRYYWLINSPQFGGASETQVGIFTYQQANGAYVILTNPVQMRSSPVISVSGNLQWTQNGSQTTVTNVTGVLSNPYNNMLGINVISGLTAGTTGRLSIAGSASGVIQFNSEL